MKICRFNEKSLGIVQGRNVKDVSKVLDQLKRQTWPPPPGDQVIANLDSLFPAMHRLRNRTNVYALRDLSLNSPIARPSKVIGAPVNYRAHQEEMNKDKGINTFGGVKSIKDYGLFIKSPIPVGPAEGVRLRFSERRTDHEVELAIVIGRECCDVEEKDALSYVAGYTIGLDMTIRGTEDRSLRKAVDTHSVLGPWLVTSHEVENPDQLNISLSVNGRRKQHSNTSNMIYSTRKLISYASSFYTLYPGDVIMSGTPEGVGPVSFGDILECSIEKIGTMQVPIRHI